MPGEPAVLEHQGGVHCGLGCMQPRLSFSLHFALAQDPSGVSAGQQRVGLSKVRTLAHSIGLTGLFRSVSRHMSILLAYLQYKHAFVFYNNTEFKRRIHIYLYICINI